MKMDPTAFRAQLLQNFRVRLGPGELGAMFTEFDKDNSKLIDGTEVLISIQGAFLSTPTTGTEISFWKDSVLC